MPGRPLALAVLALACACRTGASGPDADGGARTEKEAAPPATLTLDLTPEPDARALAVEVHLLGPQARSVAQLAVARRWADTRGEQAISGLSVRDARGEIGVRPLPAQAGDLDAFYALDRLAEGNELALRYVADGAQASRFGLRVGRAQASGVGHSFLLLPRLGAPVRARLRWHLGELPAGASGASSFGSGDATVEGVTAEQLGHAVYVAGAVRAVEAPAGAPPEQLVAVGDPALDAAQAFAWSSRASAVLRGFFAPRGSPSPPPEAERFSFFFVAEPGLGDAYDGAYLDRSFGLWFDRGRPFDAPLRIVVAHELLHRWLGGAARLRGPDGRDARWFSEGFTVHYARRLLLDAHLISPADFLADVQRTLDGDPASAGRGAASAGSSSPASASVGGDGNGTDDGYGRGALYAASLEAALRRAGRRPLDDLVRDLVARGEREGPLPVEAFRELVVTELGATAGDDFDRLVLREEAPILLPEDAFGPCFHRAGEGTRPFDLGFEARSLLGTPALIHGLVRGSAADLAGVREGALVLASKVPRPEDVRADRARGPLVELTLADARGGRHVRYRPLGSRRAPRWALRSCP